MQWFMKYDAKKPDEKVKKKKKSCIQIFYLLGAKHLDV